MHFPKEFVSVQVNGPKIPASILITSIPSKRRKFSEYKYEVLSKISKTNEENDAENDFEGNWRQENKVNEVLENTLKTQNNGSKSKKQMSEKESKIVQVVFNGNRNMKR